MSQEYRNIATGFGIIALITGVLCLAWVSTPINGHTLRIPLTFGIPILSAYGLCTRFGAREPRFAWRNIALALVSAVFTGFTLPLFHLSMLELGDTRVSIDAVVACLWGLAWVGLWLFQRRKVRSAGRWPLAVGLTFLISGFLHMLLDIGLNYGPK